MTRNQPYPWYVWNFLVLGLLSLALNLAASYWLILKPWGIASFVLYAVVRFYAVKPWHGRFVNHEECPARSTVIFGYLDPVGLIVLPMIICVANVVFSWNLAGFLGIAVIGISTVVITLAKGLMIDQAKLKVRSG